MTDHTQTRQQVLEVISGLVGLDKTGREKLDAEGRLDRFTAVDSLLMVELVLQLEENFGVRFDPEDIDAELISDIGRLTEFVDRTRLTG